MTSSTPASNESATRYIIGVDVGGTFTDLFVLNEQKGEARVIKVPSTRGQEALGFMNGVRQINEGDSSKAISQIATLVHGTTVATNALLERKVAKTGLITTKGFRDVLEMRRRDRPHTWGLRGDFIPLISRDLRLEVNERVLADGSVLDVLDPHEVQVCAKQLLDAGCEAVCVFFINAYANPSNENAALQALRQVWPNQYVTAASEV
jgi:N-methylhydantoinase A